MDKRYFAVGLKGWVQVRCAEHPPIPITTTASRTVQEKTSRYIPGQHYGDPALYKPARIESGVRNRKIVMNVTVFKGGRVLRTIKSAKFSKLLKIALKENGMMELLPEQVDTLLKECVMKVVEGE